MAFPVSYDCFSIEDSYILHKIKKSQINLTADLEDLNPLFQEALGCRHPITILFKLRDIYAILINRDKGEFAQKIYNVAMLILSPIRTLNLSIQDAETIIQSDGTTKVWETIAAVCAQNDFETIKFNPFHTYSWETIGKSINSIFGLFSISVLKVPFEELLKLVPTLTAIDYSFDTLSVQELKQLIEVSVSAKKMFFRSMIIDQDIMQALENSSVESLYLSGCEIRVESLNFNNCKNLNELSIHSPIAFEGDIHLTDTKVSSVSLSSCHNYKGIIFFPRETPLRFLAISDCNQWSQDLTNLDFSEIKNLILRHCPSFPSHSPLDLSNALKLEELQLALENWNGLLSFPQQGSLTSVDLIRCHRLNPSAIWDFSGHPNLQSLNFYSCRFLNNPIRLINPMLRIASWEECPQFNQPIVISFENINLTISFKNCHNMTQIIDVSAIPHIGVEGDARIQSLVFR